MERGNLVMCFTFEGMHSQGACGANSEGSLSTHRETGRTVVAVSDSQPCTAREGQDDSGSRQEGRELRMKVAIAFYIEHLLF